MNEEKVIEVLAAIEKGEPGMSLDQNAWFSRGYDGGCGTTACLAGWTVHLEGYEPVWTDMGHGLAVASWVTRPDRGANSPVVGLAARILELDSHQSSRLFLETEDMSDIYGVVACYMGIDRRVLRDKVLDKVSR